MCQAVPYNSQSLLDNEETAFLSKSSLWHFFSSTLDSGASTVHSVHSPRRNACFLREAGHKCQELSDGLLRRTHTTTQQAFLSSSSFTSLQVCKETASQLVIRHAELPSTRYRLPDTVACPHSLAAGTFIITRRRMTRVVTLRSSSELESLSLFVKS